jgi:hypothetical protein
VGARVLTPRLGEGPTSAERIDRLERVVAELLAWKAEHEAKEANGEDGEPSPPLPSPPWFPIKAAAPAVGYSESGLRAAMKRHMDGPKWWRFHAGRLLVNIDTCPRKRKRT